MFSVKSSFLKKTDVHSTSFFFNRRWVAFLFGSAISCTHNWITKWIANHILDIRHSFSCSSCKWRIFRCQPNQSCLYEEISIVKVHEWVTLWQTRSVFPKSICLDGWFVVYQNYHFFLDISNQYSVAELMKFYECIYKYIVLFTIFDESTKCFISLLNSF